MDAAPAPTWARDDLVLAVRETLAAHGRLLSQGELCVLERFLGLSAPAASLYARLHGRRGELFALEPLAYAEILDPRAAAAELVEAGFAWRGEAVLGGPAFLPLHAVPALRAACKALGRPADGARDALCARLSDGAARPLLVKESLLLRHEALFRRLARLFLGRADGDLRLLVMERLQILRWPRYTATGGAGLFPDRRSLRAWEEGLELDARLFALPADALGAALRARRPLDEEILARSPVAEDWRRRFTARRRAERRLEALAGVLEREGETAEAEGLWALLIGRGFRPVAGAVLRQALCLEALGRPAEGARLCASWLERGRLAPGEEALALQRTGRRLARASGLGWAPSPPLRSPRERNLTMLASPLAGRRPGWATLVGPRPLEEAVVALLAGLGRRALHAENELWRTLFGLLFAEVLFLPVPGMLPTPSLSAPLDLGSPGFVARRQEAVTLLLARIAAGEAPDLLDHSLATRRGESIAGVAWARFEDALLRRVLDELGGPAIAAILGAIASDWRHATRGLPDLLLLAGPELELPGAFPARLPSGALLAELKGPGDQLRDGQRVWLDRLLQAGLRAELWHIAPAPPVPGLPGPG